MSEKQVKFAVVDLNNADPKDRIWMKFDTEEQAKFWASNYNENSRRKRNFGIETIEE